MKTIKLQGNDYAKVADRIKMFREDCPNGEIETSHKILDNGSVVMSAMIIKDRSDSCCAKANGSSFGEVKDSKGFEKLETVAVGRALAFLGYMASGEVASADEMQEFIDYKDNKKQEAIDFLGEAKDIEELKQRFLSLGNLMSDKEVISEKDELKKTLK